MAPLEVMPHAVHLFLEQVSHKLWDDGWFYLNGPHVLQAGPQAPDDEEHEEALLDGADERMLALKPFRNLQLDSLAFPEYSDSFPHLPWTLGFTGRPGGPDFYINKVDNTKTHGPGGQLHHDLAENADPCFAKVVHGMETLEAMSNAPTVQEETDYRFFFEEPIELIKVRVVQDPTKPIAVTTEEKVPPKHEDTSTQHIETHTQHEDTTAKVEIAHHEAVQHEQHDADHLDENHPEHHLHRHRKHPHTKFRPEHSVAP
jgi:cyclophilin family peptidyl-prolyl cis-trans isomerase